MKHRSLALAYCLSILSLSLGSAFGQVTSNQIYTGLISYWPMDQLNTNNGIVTTPDVVSGLNLTATGGVTVGGGGEFSNAITLNGTTGFLSSTNTSPAIPTNNLASGLPYYDGQPMTIALWIKAAQPSSTTHYVFAMGSTTNANILYLVQSGSAAATESNLDCILRNQNGTAPVSHPHTTNALFNTTATWHHLAWVDSNGVVSVYQDGVLESQSMVFSYWPDALISQAAESGSGTYLQVMPINTFALGALVRGGSSAPSGFLAGTFDDVAVWDRALSQAEVQYVMNNSIAQPVPALAPSFAVPWVGQTNAMGDYVILNANAVGTPPMSLQWYENGSAIAGATNETLDLPVFNATMTNSGTNSIYVVATNPNGSVTNGPANLVVLPDPAPQLSVGCYASWPLYTVTNVSSTNATTPDLYQGNNFNLTNLTSANIVPGEFTNALSFSSASAQDAYLDGIVPAFDFTNYSISFWVNGTGSGQVNDIVFDNASSTSGTPFLSFGTGQSASGPLTNLCCYLRSDQSQAQLPFVLSSNSVLDGTWHHVVWVDKGGAVTLYVDGDMDPAAFSYIRTNGAPTLRSNLTWTLNSEALACSWRVKSASARMTCEMSDVAWWARALSYTEVQYLQTNPVPPPSVLITPTIGPMTSITNAYVGDSDAFSPVVTGSAPLSLQWYFNATSNYTGAAISPANNATATNSSLTFANAQATNSGYYYLVASNGAAPGSGLSGGGMATSAVVQLVVTAYSAPPTNVDQTVLQLEFNAAATPTNVQPGFQSMTLSTPSGVFNNTTRVTLSGFGGAVLADRDRNATAPPNTVSNNPPALTTALIYNSFIFDDATTAGSGINVLIQHLAPNTPYLVTLWSFDPETAQGDPTVYSYWTETLSGTVIANPYSFGGGLSTEPTVNGADTMAALLTSDPNGQLNIQGVTDPASGANFGVFLNALTIIANPSPSITTNSPSITNAYVGDADSFTVNVAGDEPISLQWYYSVNTNYDGTAISEATNSTLSFPYAQLTNAGYYYLVASNAEGSITSAVLQLEVSAYPAAPPTNVNQVVLQLEFNAVATATNVQPGFQSMTLDSGPTVFNGTTKVTVYGIDGAVLEDRDRNASAPPNSVTNNPPVLTTALLYNSFIFNEAETAGSGLDVHIQHLAPSTQYGVNLWSFDPASHSTRVSDWSETNSGATIMNEYFFDGLFLPVADYGDTFGALLMSDTNGAMNIQGVVDPGYANIANSPEVFLNALVITANPVPQILSCAINPADGNLLIVAQAQYSGQTTIIFQESPDLINWQNATDGVNASNSGPIYTSEFPLSANQMFYRVVYQPLGPQH